MCHKQTESFLRRVLKRFSARNYCIAPRLWQPDFGWDHSGVPLAFSMPLTTYTGLFDGIKRRTPGTPRPAQLLLGLKLKGLT
jgi:hypothetical protein